MGGYVIFRVVADTRYQFDVRIISSVRSVWFDLKVGGASLLNYLPIGS